MIFGCTLNVIRTGRGSHRKRLEVLIRLKADKPTFLIFMTCFIP
jgi:hypothetical protein